MTDELRRLAERRRQNIAADVERIVTTRTPATRPEDRLGVAHAPGARVFDIVTGQEGEVISATRENVVLPTANR